MIAFLGVLRALPCTLVGPVLALPIVLAGRSVRCVGTTLEVEAQAFAEAGAPARPAPCSPRSTEAA